MNEGENCIFCKIVNNEIPSTKVYEDGDFLAFVDIKPMLDGHLLLIPKKHIVWMQDSEDEMIAQIFILTKKLMLAIKNGIGCDFVQVSVVGQEMPHFHIHLIPRYLNDGLPNFPFKDLDQEKTNKLVEKIKTNLF